MLTSNEWEILKLEDYNISLITIPIASFCSTNAGCD